MRSKLPSVTCRQFGTMPDGTTIEEYVLSYDGSLNVHVCTYGATVTQLHAPDDRGTMADVVLGFDRLEPYLGSHPYFGCIAGRVAGRITRGRFSLDGIDYQLAVNDPPNHLHGGPAGFDRRVWRVVEVDQPTSSLTLALNSCAGDQGYPGTVDVTVTFRLTADRELVISYRATSDRPTPLNLTNHAYFNLAGESSGTMLNHTLQIAADHYALADAFMTLTGIKMPVQTGANDFRNAALIAERIAHVHNRHGDLYFSSEHPTLAPRLVAKLSEPVSGRVMEVWTTEPCLQLYLGTVLDGTLIGKGGQPYIQHAGACLECHRYPDGVNNSELGNIIVRPGETYSQTTVYRFSTASAQPTALQRELLVVAK